MIERPRYFFGQLLTADEFTQEQDYHREKARRHNRTLHGWGIVSGLEVGKGRAGAVTINPGNALDPYGEEIVVERKVVVPLGVRYPDGNSVAPCAAEQRAPRPSIAVKRPVGKPLHVAIRYAECLLRPVTVLDQGGGETVKYSRTGESFAVEILTALPRRLPRRSRAAVRQPVGDPRQRRARARPRDRERRRHPPAPDRDQVAAKR